MTLQRTHNLESRSGYNDYYDYEEDDDPEMGDLIDSYLSLNQWFDSKGKSVSFGDMKLEKSEIFSSEPFGEGKADETEKEDYTGNAGATVDLWYRRAAVVLWKIKLRTNYRIIIQARVGKIQIRAGESCQSEFCTGR